MLADHLSGSHADQGGFDLPATCDFLAFENRKYTLEAEMLQHSPDVMCIQEMDTVHFNTWFQPRLAEIYESMHSPKTNAKDGPAVFFKRALFQAVYSKILALGPEDHAQVMLSVRLRRALDGREFVVQTAHLKATKSQEGEMVRLHQVQTMVENTAKEVPVVICADLNALPHDTREYRSFAYHELCKSFVSTYQYATGKEPAFTTFKSRAGVVSKHTIGKN